ncbi:hypothetical protein COU56_04640 [Candidatus Pacearchaeota archaeon CG10_big_fil_rev_8_21_14_0_10_31_9]|nr:MAG: hypothetical protein AUJ62_02855 [Candidatus Pacearchaeota archaeon CG1_02_32_21]PIN91757.1 MAG: hypothetical protein COU56_04640 [Candidatus Pacearchaeota archaeon CG10_big_fil_rev_8_21_14_0_10_31_9]PIZ83775.1 MAG: hypothetical protein COX97_00520 [Candidatus Pacearchaeota archaeon CG_4_10_14_0_2_um_filter_05_32_18]
MKAYTTTITLDDKGNMAQLIYDGNLEIMELNLIDYNKRKSRTFYRQGNDEERMRGELLEVSGVRAVIDRNYDYIQGKVSSVPVGRDFTFRNIWELAA